MVFAAGIGLSLACGAPIETVDGIDLVELLPMAELRVETSDIDFGDPAIRDLLHGGWGQSERLGRQSYAWGLGEQSGLAIEIAKPRSLELTVEATPFLYPGVAPQLVDVILNGQVVGELAMTGLEMPSTPRGGNVQQYRLQLPAHAQHAGTNELTFRYTYSARPAEVNPESDDQRQLAVSWHRLRLATGAGDQLPVRRDQSLLLARGSSVSYYFAMPSGGQLRVASVAPWRDRGSGRGQSPVLAVTVEVAGEPARVEEFVLSGETLGDLAFDLPATDGAPVRLTLTTLPTDGSAGGLRLTGLAVHAAAAVPAAGIGRQLQPPATEVPPNVLIYMVDTLRADHLGCYGYARPTSPNIDRFADEATLFSGMSAQTSWTRPAVASLFTGLYPQVHGTNRREDALPESAAVLPEIFHDLGWETAAVVTNGNVGKKFGFARGFEVFNRLLERAQTLEVHQLSDKVNEAAFQWLENRERDRPFLLYLHTSDPHGPYTPRSPYRERFAPSVSDPLAGSNDRIAQIGRAEDGLDTAAVDELRDLYDGEIAFNDAAFGDLIAKLQELDLYDSTVIVLLSDHGEEFGEHQWLAHGKTLFDELLRVPLIIRFPDGRGQSAVIADTVRQIDVLPTLLDYVGIAAPAAVQGRSLLPLVAGSPAAPEADASYAYLDIDGHHLESVAVSGHKLIKVFGERDQTSRVELFDLVVDAGELVDRTAEDRVWRGYLYSLLTYRRQFWTPLDAPQVEADEELKRRLRAAGYLTD